ncbi:MULTISPECIES: 3-isopropylmalate dehydratase small subunit [unclassified Kitasatospora]|uniref:3-isopropylmalate dehydratase small subunit n=1 Tax=unclassified Kitasatospora TaxID=2633591 RepID=UPI0033E9C898
MNFEIHSGRAVVLARDDIDTDQIVPAEFCRRVVKSGYADALFANWRKEPGFVLGRPENQGASILVAGRDFGIGSSREHAVWALKDGGFRVVVAAGFGDIFRRNALNNGLLPLDLPYAELGRLTGQIAAHPGLEVVVDLRECTLRLGGTCWQFEVEERGRRMLLRGEDAIEAVLQHGGLISAHEARRPAWLPTVG